MKKIYAILITIGISIATNGQNFLETFGNAASPTPVSLYTGWSNQGLLTYTGTAVVQNNDSSYGYSFFAPQAGFVYASGGANVLLTNTPGTFFQISNFPFAYYDYISIHFGVITHDSLSVPNFKLEVSWDDGVTWDSWFYWQAFGTTSWSILDRMITLTGDSTHPPPPHGEANHTIIRFVQNSSTQSYRLDDISVTFEIALPIKLKSFTASSITGKTSLNWNALSASNAETFVVEKRITGQQFETLDKIAAKGNGEFNYSCIDKASQREAFYRLKMINADGKYSYSNIVRVTSEFSEKQLIKSIYPIPAKDVLHLEINNFAKQNITLSIINLNGQLKLQKVISSSDEINNFDLNIKSLEAGTYNLVATSSKNRQVEEVLIIR